MTIETMQAMIDARLDNIQAQMSALILFQIIFAMVLIYFMYDMRNRHTIQNLAKQMVVVARKLYKPRKNMGDAEAVRPDALPMLERFVAKYWLATQPRIMEFTESVWLQIIRQGSFTRSDWKPLTERWKSYGFLIQKDPNAKTGKGTALIVNTKRLNGMERRMQTILSTSPALAQSMPEMDKSGG